MKIKDIKIEPNNWKGYGLVGAINTLHVSSRELADIIRAMNEDTEVKRIEGRFILECRGYYQAFLTLETDDV